MKLQKIVIASVGVIILRLLLILPSILVGRIIDHINHAGDFSYSLNLLFVGIVCVSLLAFVLSPVQTKILNIYVQKIIYSLSLGAIANIFKKQYSFFQSTNIGSLLRKVERGVLAYEKLWLYILVVGIPNVVELMIISSYLAFISGSLMVLFLIVSSLMSCWVIYKTIVLRRRHIDELNQVEDYQFDALAETFIAGRTIKYLDSWSYTSQKLADTLNDYKIKAINLSFWSEIMRSTQVFLTTLVTVLTLGFGIFLFTKGYLNLSVGDLVVVFSFSGLFMTRLITLTETYKEFDQFKHDKKELDKLLLLPDFRSMDMHTSNLDPLPILKIRPFTFKINEYLTLENSEQITINHGIKVAIVGETGNGKSFFSTILSGMTISSNTILLNDIDISKLSQAQLSKVFSYSFQFPDFLSGNFERAVLLDIPFFDKERCEKALNSLKLSANIQINQSIDTKSLSGGEKKRLDILRSLIIDKPIVILDEPTSSVDFDSSRVIWDFIFENTQGKTLICVTHDETRLDWFDLVLEIDNGVIKRKESSLNSM